MRCKPCEVALEHPTFYTAKCGPNHAKVKSCARATCEPVSDQKRCLAGLQSDGEGKSAPGKASDAVRFGGGALAAEPVGTISGVVGSAKLIRVSGGVEPAHFDKKVFDGDAVETAAGGKVRVELNDRSVLTIAPDSRVAVETRASGDRAGRRRTLLNLMYGRVRAKVDKANKRDGTGSAFQVRTKSAVAGVRGTDFVTSFALGEGSWVTEVKTLEGHVEFGGESRADRADVRAGEAASFIIHAPPMVDAARLRGCIDNGILSEVRKMEAGEIERLKRATGFQILEGRDASLPSSDLGRSPAGLQSDVVCSEPEADFNWCSFTCEGNPARQSRCDTRLPGVRCVRRICNANGRWAERTVLPKSAWSSCDPKGVVVRRDCGAD